MGQHRIQVNRTATPITVLTDTIIPQTSFFCQPDEMRRSVMAKEVLLHAAPMIMNDPAKVETNIIDEKCPGIMSHVCLPKPKWMDSDTEMFPPSRATWDRRSASLCVRAR